MNSPRTLARIAGLLYLILAVCAMFSALAVRDRLITSSAAATADNIRASATLFRVGFVIDLVGATVFLLLAVALYLLLRHVHPLAAAAMVTFVAVGVAIECLNLLNQYTALTIATSADYTGAFGKAGADALTQLFANMQQDGSFIDTIFFGLWLLPLGWLVIKSGYFPKLLGILLIAACFGWLTDFFTYFLAPAAINGVSLYVDVLGGIAELSFMAWLLVIGVRVPTQPATSAALVDSHRSS